MTDPVLEKLDAEWRRSVKNKEYAQLGKILRSKVDILKASGTIAENKAELKEWVSFLEGALAQMELKESLAVIGHIRHARKSLSLSSSDLGSAFRSELSKAERTRFKRRNTPPRLELPNRTDLPPGYALGPPSHDLQPHVLGNGQT